MRETRWCPCRHVSCRFTHKHPNFLGKKVDKLAHTMHFNIEIEEAKDIFGRGQLYFCKKCGQFLKGYYWSYEDMIPLPKGNPIPLQVVCFLHCR